MSRRVVVIGGVIYVLLVGAIYGTWLVRALERPRLLPEPECQTIALPSGQPLRFCAPPVEQTN